MINGSAFQYCTNSSGIILYLRDLQDHSGRNLVDPSLQENVLISTDFFASITSDVQSIYTPSCVQDWYREDKIWAKDRWYSWRLWILWIENTKILRQSTWKHRVWHGTSIKSERTWKHGVLGRHQLCSEERIEVLSNTIERYPSSRNSPSLLFSESCSDGNWRNHLRESVCVTLTSSEDFLSRQLDEKKKKNWVQKLLEVVKTPNTPNKTKYPIVGTGRLVLAKQPSCLRTPQLTRPFFHSEFHAHAWFKFGSALIPSHVSCVIWCVCLIALSSTTPFSSPSSPSSLLSSCPSSCPSTSSSRMWKTNSLCTSVNEDLDTLAATLWQVMSPTTATSQRLLIYSESSVEQRSRMTSTTMTLPSARLFDACRTWNDHCQGKVCRPVCPRPPVMREWRHPLWNRLTHKFETSQKF